MKKEPRANKTEEQLVKDMEVARKRKIVVDKFYPALINASVSVDEAKMLIQATSTLLMEEVLKTMQERKFSDISGILLKKLSPEGERLAEIAELLAVLDGENLYVAREIIEGMTRAIEQMIGDEMRSRNLDTLKADWERMLN